MPLSEMLGRRDIEHRIVEDDLLGVVGWSNPCMISAAVGCLISIAAPLERERSYVPVGAATAHIRLE